MSRADVSARRHLSVYSFVHVLHLCLVHYTPAHVEDDSAADRLLSLRYREPPRAAHPLCDSGQSLPSGLKVDKSVTLALGAEGARAGVAVAHCLLLDRVTRGARARLDAIVTELCVSHFSSGETRWPG